MLKLEYKIPPYLEMAYGEEKIAENLSDGGKLFKRRLGKYSSQATLANYWYKSRTGLTTTTEFSLEICVVKIDDTYSAIESAEQLADFLKTFTGKKYQLKDRSEVEAYGPMSTTKIGGQAVILVTSADMNRVREHELTDGSKLMVSPKHSYYVKVADRLLIGLRVTHFNEKHYSAKWYDNAMGMAESIIETLVVTKRGKP